MMFCGLDTSVISKYPNSPEYPKFYNLSEILKKMFAGRVKIHPHTRQMLSSLDQYVLQIYTQSLTLVFAAGYVSSMQCQEPSMLFLLPACNLGSRCALGIPSFHRMDTHQTSPFIPTLCSVPLLFMAVVQKIPCERQQHSRWQS